MTNQIGRLVGIATIVSLFATPPSRPDEPSPLAIGSRRELFVDDYLIASRHGVELRLQKPVPRELVMVHDSPWEGSGCGYHTVFRDGDRIRMYYIAADLTNADGTKLASRPIYACYAESRDGSAGSSPNWGWSSSRARSGTTSSGPARAR